MPSAEFWENKAGLPHDFLTRRYAFLRCFRPGFSVRGSRRGSTGDFRSCSHVTFCVAGINKTFLEKVIAFRQQLWYVLWLPKGGAAMYDYMKALQKRFDRQEHSELDAQVERAQEELRRDMDAVGRGKLLRLLDAQNALLAESKLMSFTAGFKLAWGMTKDLEADGLYSFEREEEDHICHPVEQED